MKKWQFSRWKYFVEENIDSIFQHWQAFPVLSIVNKLLLSFHRGREGEAFRSLCGTFSCLFKCKKKKNRQRERENLYVAPFPSLICHFSLQLSDCIQLSLGEECWWRNFLSLRNNSNCLSSLMFLAQLCIYLALIIANPVL